MKTFVRLVRRYVLLAVGISLLLILLALAMLIWLTVRFGSRWQEQFDYSYSEIADHLQQDADGNFFFDEKDAAFWMNGYAWAMVLDDNGQVIWQYQLPEDLNRHYADRVFCPLVSGGLSGILSGADIWIAGVGNAAGQYMEIQLLDLPGTD